MGTVAPVTCANLKQLQIRMIPAKFGWNLFCDVWEVSDHSKKPLRADKTQNHPYSLKGFYGVHSKINGFFMSNIYRIICHILPVTVVLSKVSAFGHTAWAVKIKRV